MIKPKEIFSQLEVWAPLDLQEEWDHSGIQVYFDDSEITGIVIAMDVTDKVVDYAIENKANLIITHHPFLFGGIDRIDDRTYKGRLLKKLIQKGINVYAAHTNMDKAPQGVNDRWIPMLNLKDVKPLDLNDEIGIIGNASYTLENLVKRLEELDIPIVQGFGKKIRKIEKIAVLGGSGSDYIKLAADSGADILLTADVKYHEGQMAYELGLMVLDIGHYHSEKYILEPIKDFLLKRVENIPIKIHWGSEFAFEL